MRLPPLILSFFLVLSTAQASLDPSSFLNVNNDALKQFAAFVGLGADLVAYESTNAYSSDRGIDFGASATAIAMPGSVTNALTRIGVPNVLHYIPIAKINVQKSIGPKLFIGTEILPSIKIGKTRIEIYGGDIQFRMLDRPRVPPVALRAQYNYANIGFIKTQTLGADLLTRIKVSVVDIYGGTGYRFVTSNISNPTAFQPSTQNLNFSPQINTAHFFAGVTMTAGFARITTEANLTSEGINTYGTKLSFFF